MPVKELHVNLGAQQGKGLDIAAKRRVLSRVLEGSWTALLKGRGMEFAGFRQYVYGDDASRIDWGATLRSKDVLVREFEEYKMVNIFFLLDVSDTMLFSSTQKLKCEYAAELVFHIASATIEAGNSVGYVLFSDRIVAKGQLGIGRDVLYRLAQDLSDGRNYGGVRDWKRVMNQANTMLQQRSLIILVSDFIDLPEGWDRYVKMFSFQNDLIGIMVRDVRDHALPKQGLQVAVSAPSGGETLLVDLQQYAAAYAEAAAEEEDAVRSIFEKARSGFLKLELSSDPIDAVIKYFRKRSNAPG